MKHIASCSFGKDSMATVILALEHGEPLDAVVYCEVMFDKEISGEVPEHRDFIYNTAIPWMEQQGVPVYIVRSEQTYISNFYYVTKRSKVPERNGKLRSFPNGKRCFMNGICKVAPINKWYKKNCAKIETKYIGIAADEPKRLARLEGTNKVSLLAKYGYTEADAAELCKKHGLYSPVYEFSKRNGCWFCPNCRMSEFAEFKRRHPDLWQRLLDLGKVENLVSYDFRYGKTVEQVDEEISMQAAQMKIEDLEG